MGLKAEEFEKMTGITKKKVLINMTGLKQTIVSDPNSSLQETRLRSLQQLIAFADENSLFLNSSSKSLIAEQFQRLVKNSDSNLRQAVMGSIQTQVSLVNVTREFLDLESQEQLRYQLSRIYMEEGEHMFHDITLDQAPQFSKVISFLCKDNPMSGKL